MTKEQTMPTLSTLVQEKGQVTIPLEIRKKLNLKKGDRVVFIETEQGVVIQPAELVVSAAMAEIGAELKRKGVSFEQILERGREIRGELIQEEYGITDNPTP